MRLAARLLGWLFLVLALLVAGADALHSLERGAVTLAPLGQVWFRLDHGSLNLAQAVVQRYLHPALWDPPMIWLLNQPAVVVFAVLAALFLLLGRRRGGRRLRFGR